VARAVYESQIPIICGVGHEVDYSIADLVADVRAPTPSAAAELVSPDQSDLLAAVTGLQRRLVRAAKDVHEDNASYLSQLQRRLDNQHPSNRLRQRIQRCDELDLRLQRAMQLAAAQANSRHTNLSQRLRNLSPQKELLRRRERLNALRARLDGTGERCIESARARLRLSERALKAISPLNTLARGYAIVQRGEKVVTSATEVNVDESIDIRLADGKLAAKISKTSPG